MDTPRLSPREIAELQQHVGYGSAWLGPVLVSGQGSRVTDIDGKHYIDCTAQAWTLALGYNHPDLVEAAVAQVRTLPHVRAGFPTLPRLLLAKRLADLCPGRLGTVTYAPTGSLGVETALKLAMINRPGGEVPALLPQLRPRAECLLLPLPAAPPLRRVRRRRVRGPKFKPPLVIEEAEIDTVLSVLADCLKVVFP